LRHIEVFLIFKSTIKNLIINNQKITFLIFDPTFKRGILNIKRKFVILPPQNTDIPSKQLFL